MKILHYSPQGLKSVGERIFAYRSLAKQGQKPVNNEGLVRALTNELVRLYKSTDKNHYRIHMPKAQIRVAVREWLDTQDNADSVFLGKWDPIQDLAHSAAQMMGWSRDSVDPYVRKRVSEDLDTALKLLQEPSVEEAEAHPGARRLKAKSTFEKLAGALYFLGHFGPQTPVMGVGSIPKADTKTPPVKPTAKPEGQTPKPEPKTPEAETTSYGTIDTLVPCILGARAMGMGGVSSAVVCSVLAGASSAQAKAVGRVPEVHFKPKEEAKACPKDQAGCSEPENYFEAGNLLELRKRLSQGIAPTADLIHLAVTIGDQDLVAELLSVDPKLAGAKDQDGKTPLERAVDKYNDITRNAGLNEAAIDMIGMIKLLEPDKEDKKQRALWEECEKGMAGSWKTRQERLIDILKYRGLTQFFEELRDGIKLDNETFFHLTWLSNSDNAFEIIKTLSKRQIDLSDCDAENVSHLLRYAMSDQRYNKRFERRFLFRTNVSLNLPGIDGLSLAAHATMSGDQDLLDYCLDHNVDINKGYTSTDASGQEIYRTLIDIAASNLDEGMLKFLIKRGADINQKGPNNDTALFRAASKKDLSAFAFLLKHGADPYITPHGETLAVQALIHDDLVAFKAAGLDLEIGNRRAGEDVNEGATILFISALRGDLVDLRKIIKAKAVGKINTPERRSGNTPISSALHLGHTLVAKELLLAGANPMLGVNINGRYDEHGEDLPIVMGSALHLAVAKQNLCIVEMLLKDPRAEAMLNMQDSNGNTVMHLAVQKAIETDSNPESIGILRALLSVKKSPCIKNNDGKKPYELVNKDAEPKLYQGLKENLHVGEENEEFFTASSVPGTETFQTYEQYIRSQSHLLDVRVLSMIIKPGMRLSQETIKAIIPVDITPRELLILADDFMKKEVDLSEMDCETKRDVIEKLADLEPDKIKPFLQATKIDIDAVNKIGYSLLATAIIKGNTKLVDLLLTSGANPNAMVRPRDDGGDWFYPLIEMAAGYGRTEIIRKLVEAGADIEAVSSHGSTPLTAALRNLKTEAAALLIDLGADMYAEDSAGNTAAHFAAEHVTAPGMFTIITKIAQNQDAHKVENKRGIRPDDILIEKMKKSSMIGNKTKTENDQEHSWAYDDIQSVFLLSGVFVLMAFGLIMYYLLSKNQQDEEDYQQLQDQFRQLQAEYRAFRSTQIEGLEAILTDPQNSDLDSVVLYKQLIARCLDLGINTEDIQESLIKFQCPITMEVMTDPVVIERGQSVDLRSLQNWEVANRENRQAVHGDNAAGYILPNPCAQTPFTVIAITPENGDPEFRIHKGTERNLTVRELIDDLCIKQIPILEERIRQHYAARTIQRAYRQHKLNSQQLAT